MSVSTLFVRDGKTWLLGSQNVNLTTVAFGPAGGLIRVETPIVAQNL